MTLTSRNDAGKNNGLLFPALPPRRQAGFTLIEILIVVGLIALIMSLALPSLGNALKVNLSSSGRELASIIRTTHDEAVLKGQVYRMAFNLDKGEYWAEIGERDFLMRTAAQEEAERKRNERRSPEEREQHKDAFALAQSVTKRKLKLPRGVKFNDIVTAHTKEAAQGGTTYAYFFPHGFVEKLIIHLKDTYDRESTLMVSSVTGKSRIYDYYFKEGR